MSMDEAPRAIFIGGPEDQYPPWTDAQRDAQIEALRTAFVRLVGELELAGILPPGNVASDIEGSTLFFDERRADTIQALRYLAHLLRPQQAAQ